MRRREFITFLGGAALTWPLVARAQQQAGKVYRIGILEPTSQTLNGDNLDAFRQGLHEFEYIEGQNLVIDRPTGTTNGSQTWRPNSPA